MHNELDSIFEIFRVGSGPSSSHSMGPERATRLFMKYLPIPPRRVRVVLMGSLAATGRGHLTDRVIANSLRGTPHDIVWDTTTSVSSLPHPNTMRFEALSGDGMVYTDWTVMSVGGGSLRDDEGPVHDSAAPVSYPMASIREALDWCSERDLRFCDLVEEHETGLYDRLGTVWDAMRESVERGLASEEPCLPGELQVSRRARLTHERLLPLDSPRRDLALLSAFALAVAEENAAAGRIVTAPTCGSAGVLPGLLYYFRTVKGVPRDEILRALATAGLFGAAIKANASISGAEVGCQGEIGSACSMAAAAGAQILGGSLHQIEYAAEVGMEHHLGLTCDPVLGYVQIPCIERNMTACLRAFECASFALLTDGRHLVSFDDVVDVMFHTGRDLQSTYRETAAGGLALLWQGKTPGTGGGADS